MPGLFRASVAPAVVGDAAITALSQEEHLILEGVRRERPAVAEHDGLSVAPVVVMDPRAVLRSDRAHGMGPMWCWSMRGARGATCTRGVTLLAVSVIHVSQEAC